MPRLLFITERFPPDVGGLASSADRITKSLCQLGVEVDILTWSRYLQAGEVVPSTTDPKSGSHPPPLSPPCGKPLARLQPQPLSDPPLPPLKKGGGRGEPEAVSIWDDSGLARVYRVGLYRHWDSTLPHTLNVMEWLHQSRSYDALWGHYLFPSGFLATWFAKLQGLVSTVSVRGNDLDRAMFPPGDFARLLWTLQTANLVTAVSSDLAQKIQLLSQRDDVLVIKNAVDDRIFSPLSPPTSSPLTPLPTPSRSSLAIAPDEVVLGFSGELREKKGQQFLLNALTTVRATRPACLLIIGEVRASQETALQLYATQYPEAAQRIIITGHLRSPLAVAQHLRLCDVYLQPSLWEGLPNALLEAMACGCCCIASDAGGIPEVIDRGQNGFIVERPYLHRLGEAVLECLDLPEEVREQIRRAAGDRIQSEYSLEREKLRLQAVLTRLIPNS